MTRENIYYWKCDRPAAFHGSAVDHDSDTAIEGQLSSELCRHFDTRDVQLSPGIGQGNHLTWKAVVDGVPMFLRVENGPEQDHHLSVESAILDRVRESGVSTPLVYGCDASRERVSFAWQALELISEPDLNHWQKCDSLDSDAIAFQIGAAVATWQTVKLPDFGVLDDNLCGYHQTYADYFHLNLEQHLRFLVEKHFIDETERDAIATAIAEHSQLLELGQGCLVHKDLALWNILGTSDKITAFIDFDDAIGGDPMDDLSLLACFHDAAFVQRAIAGYQSFSLLPDEFLRRFWMHLLRNMIVKAVIRIGSGYFDRDDQFFLIGSGANGIDLKQQTHDRLKLALRGLCEELDFEYL